MSEISNTDPNLPKIETFESDISEEMKRREANMNPADSAGITVVNNSLENKSNSSTVFIILAIIFFILAIGGFIWYSIYSKNQIAPPVTKVQDINTTTSTTTQDDTLLLQNSLPVLNYNVGRFISSIKTTDYGYDLKINDYTSVFGFVIKNEDSLVNDFATILGVKLNDPSVTPNYIDTSTSTEVSTSTSTSIESSTSTLISASTTTTIPITTSNNFVDVTINNQNMRVLNNISGTIVYSFLNTDHLLLSTSTEGILFMRSAIIK